MAIADSYDGFLIDLDGVVWLGGELVAGADRAINELLDAGKRIAIVTNSPRFSPIERAVQLRESGVEIGESQVITAGQVLIELVRTEVGAGSPVLASGTGAFLQQVEAGGLSPIESRSWNAATAVLVTAHDRFNYEELRAAAMAARAGALLAATARDPTLPMPDGLWPGTGAVLAAVETASGRTAHIAGKPETPIFEAGLRALDLPGTARVAMIGDRLDTDVGGAQAAGIDGILVDGNASSPEPGESEIRPDRRIGALIDLVG